LTDNKKKKKAGLSRIKTRKNRRGLILASKKKGAMDRSLKKKRNPEQGISHQLDKGEIGKLGGKKRICAQGPRKTSCECAKKELSPRTRMSVLGKKGEGSLKTGAF